MLTLTERKTRVTFIQKVERKQASEVVISIENNKEFVNHEDIAKN